MNLQPPPADQSPEGLGSRFGPARSEAGGGWLAYNIVQFVRLLRAAGLAVGPAKSRTALEALALVRLDRRQDVRAALAAVLIDGPEQRPIFDRAFEAVWRSPAARHEALQPHLPQATRREPAKPAPAARRLLDALQARGPDAPTPSPLDSGRIPLEAGWTASARERLQSKDFEQMSAQELSEAKRLLERLRSSVPVVRTRRAVASRTPAAVDLRATLRRSLRTGGEWLVPRFHEPGQRPCTLVALCDISGSMAAYSRMLLHFLHALSATRASLHCFTFGTQLSNITRALRRRDVDQALADIGRTVPDWSGGTRIDACLREFNRRWSRRVLAQGALVLLITDGLNCGDDTELAAQMKRLHGSCRGVVWLNPLLRYRDFEPRSAGIRAMLPYVDRFVPAHNLNSLGDLGRTLVGLERAARQSNPISATRQGASQRWR